MTYAKKQQFTFQSITNLSISLFQQIQAQINLNKNLFVTCLNFF
jgi:hypothetical protein